MLSSGSSDSSENVSHDDLLSPFKRRSSLVDGDQRRLTSSNIEYANLQGITPTDAQALLEKEQNREMYRQNLKRRLEEADRENYNLQYKQDKLCKKAVKSELKHQ